MPITVKCPSCQKSLKVPDAAAGKRIKCPSCSAAVVVPAGGSFGDGGDSMEDDDDVSMERLSELVAEKDAAGILALICRCDWTLITDPENSDDDGNVPLFLSIDDFPAMVVMDANERIDALANEMPDILNNDGSAECFVVAGRDLLMPGEMEFGLIFNPFSDDDCVVITPDLVARVMQAAKKTPRGNPKAANPKAQAIRDGSMKFVTGRGFQPADWLPLPDLTRQLRSVEETASRLMALNAVFIWASAPDSAAPSDRVQSYIKQNKLSRWFTPDEREILSTPRAKARDTYCDTVGWRLENMWPLAWALGFDPIPSLMASQIEADVSQKLMFEFLKGLDVTHSEMVQRATYRSRSEVIALEDRFYCAHNAVRSAQLGEDTVPNGFDPVGHGGAVHERRHSLTWLLSPGTDWDEIDLST